MTDQHYAGPTWRENAYIAGVALHEAEGKFSLGLADGRIITRLIDRPETQLHEVKAHEGLAMLVPGFEPGHTLSIGEDGRLVAQASGLTNELAHFEKTWLENIALYPDDQLIAVSARKNIYVLNAEGQQLAQFSNHPSGVTGITFDPKGKRIAASHYNGVSLWWAKGDAAQTPQVLAWKGSHLGVNWSPNNKYILTYMQENALHGWRVPTFENFAMSGYGVKPRSISWSHDNRWLASSGSAGVVCWDCSGKGPMGRAATVLGQDCPDLTTQVACHPKLDMVAAGTSTGLIYLARFQDDTNVWLKTHSTSEITLMCWSETGQYLFAAHEDGQANMWQFGEE